MMHILRKKAPKNFTAKNVTLNALKSMIGPDTF
jgi:hypothetical protein